MPRFVIAALFDHFVIDALRCVRRNRGRRASIVTQRLKGAFESSPAQGFFVSVFSEMRVLVLPEVVLVVLGVSRRFL